MYPFLFVSVRYCEVPAGKLFPSNFNCDSPRMYWLLGSVYYTIPRSNSSRIEGHLLLMPTQLTEGSKALQPSDGNTSHKPPSRKTYTKQTASNSSREMVASGHSYRTNVTNPRMFHSQMTWASGVKSSEAGRVLKAWKRNVQNKKRHVEWWDWIIFF